MKKRESMATKARTWLPEQVSDCPIQTRKLFERAEESGISRHAVSRIRRELGIQTGRRDGRWWWYGDAHAHLFSVKKPEQALTAIRTPPPTELCVVDFTVPKGFRILKLPPMMTGRLK